MRKRLLKILIRIVIVLLVLGVLGLIAFSWICYWPLEGEVEELDGLVPRQVEFVLSGDYDDLKQTGWIQQNILGRDPLHPELGAQVDQHYPQMRAELQALDDQINAQIPLGIVDFSIERDVLAGEVALAGVFCEDTRPPAAPAWQELLILKRLSWKPRAALAAALGHEWIRDMAIPKNQARLQPSEREGIFKLTISPLLVPVRPEIQRAGCGRGFVMPPDNEWYVFLYKDVVAISNSKSIIDAVHVNSLTRDDAELSITTRRGFEFQYRDPGTVGVWAELEPLQRYLIRLQDEGGQAAKLLGRFLNLRTLQQAAGTVELSDPNTIFAQFEVDLRKEGLHPNVQDVYALSQESMTEGLAQFVPAKDTFFAATLRMQPGHFFEGLVDDYLTSVQRREIDRSVRSGGKYENLGQFLAELAERLGNTSYMAVGRLSDEFDAIDYPDWYAKAHDPFPAFAFMTRIREGTNLEEVNEFLKERVLHLGFSSEFEQREHLGIPYTRIKLDMNLRDYALASPCWLLAHNHFVMSVNEDYFKKMIETIADPSKSLAADNNFRVTMARLRERGHVGVFVDLDKIFAVPESAGVGEMPRGFLWDHRNKWVHQYRAARDAAISRRAELEREFRDRNRGRLPNDQELRQIDKRVDDFVEAWIAHYPDYVEEYRRSLAGFARLRSFGMMMGATGRTLSVDVGLLLEQPEGSSDGTSALDDGE